jgi:hypothetical protein
MPTMPAPEETSTTWPRPRAHPGENRSHRVQRAQIADPHRLLEHVDRHPREVARVDDAGGRDREVAGPDRSLRVRDRRRDGIPIGDVYRYREHPL